MKKLFTFVLMAILCQALCAQTTRRNSKTNRDVVNKYTTAWATVKNDIISNEEQSDELNPYYLSVFTPGTYLSRATHQAFTLDVDAEAAEKTLGMRMREQMDSLANANLFKLYTTTPNSFNNYDEKFMKETLVESEEPIESDKELNSIIASADEVTDVAEVTGDVDVDLAVTKPNFWKRKGSFGLQFTQNYFSDNWYKGGNNTQSMLTSLILEANYDNQKKLQWDNKLEMRLGFITTTSDTCHTFLTNNDKLYARSKLGIKAAKSWFYTVAVEAQTQFMPSYRTNDRRKYGAFFAPFDLFASIGMDFKPTLKNDNAFSLALLPLSYKMRYIGSDDLNIHTVYNMVGEDCTHDIGSKVEANLTYHLAKNLTWTSRFYYFTSYKYAEGEFENKFDFKFSQYISAQIFTLWRFDDNRSRDYYDRNLGYFQFNEYLTFGLAYSF